jgi:hypothetical protein
MTAIPFAGQLGLPGWVVLSAALLVWVALLWIVTRLVLRGHERVCCPLSGQIARVTFVRGPDGSREDVVRCSLQPGGITCARICRAAV